MTATRAVVVILFGLCVLLWPGLEERGFAVLFGVFALVDGVVLAGLAVVGRDVLEQWWLMLVEGALSAALGVVALAWPGITGLTLLWLLALWAVLTGIAEIESGIRLRRLAAGELSLLLAGGLSVAAGLALFAFPTEDALRISPAVGAFALVYGAALLAVALRLRRLARAARRHEVR